MAAAAIDRPLWAMTDHVCRSCFGRVLEAAEAAPDGHRYRCSNCGLEATGRRPAALCTCGTKLKNGRGDAGVRCERNPEPTPEFPSEIVSSQVAS